MTNNSSIPKLTQHPRSQSRPRRPGQVREAAPFKPQLTREEAELGEMGRSKDASIRQSGPATKSKSEPEPRGRTRVLHITHRDTNTSTDSVLETPTKSQKHLIKARDMLLSDLVDSKKAKAGERTKNMNHLAGIGRRIGLNGEISTSHTYHSSMEAASDVDPMHEYGYRYADITGNPAHREQQVECVQLRASRDSNKPVKAEARRLGDANAIMRAKMRDRVEHLREAEEKSLEDQEKLRRGELLASPEAWEALDAALEKLVRV